MWRSTSLIFLLLHLTHSQECPLTGDGSCECVKIHSTPNTIININAKTITITGSGLRYCIINPTSCLFTFLASNEGTTARGTGTTAIKTTTTKTQAAIFGSDITCIQNPSSCDTAVAISLDVTTSPTSIHTGPLYIYVSCSSPVMSQSASVYWYTRQDPTTSFCTATNAQTCSSIFTHYPGPDRPDFSAGILAGEVTDPGHVSNVIGTDRAPMVGHIGSLSSATPTKAEASGKGLDSTSTKVSFSFTSGAPGICSSPNSSFTTGCMASQCSWIDLESGVSANQNALLNNAGNEITCPFVLWPHRAGLTFLRLCVNSLVRFNKYNITREFKEGKDMYGTIDDQDIFCFLWSNVVPSGGSSTTPPNAVPFNLTETWSEISRNKMDVYGGQITFVRGNGFDVQVHEGISSAPTFIKNEDVISSQTFDDIKLQVGKGGSEDGGVGYRVRLQMGRFETLVDAYPLSGSGLIFATPQIYETSVRLKVSIEKLVIIGTSIRCNVLDRSNRNRCHWKKMIRTGETAALSKRQSARTSTTTTSTTTSDDTVVSNIWLDIEGSCGDVNAPTINLTLSIFNSPPPNTIQMDEMTSISLYNVYQDRTMKHTNTYRTDAINVTLAKTNYLKSLQNKKNSVASTFEHINDQVSDSDSNGLDITSTTATEFSYGISDSSGLILIFAYVSELSTKDVTGVKEPERKTLYLGNTTSNRIQHVLSRSVLLFSAGLQIDGSYLPKSQRCHFCDRTLASGWNHIMMLSRIAPTGTGQVNFSRTWYSPDSIQGWGDDIWKQTTIPLFANTNMNNENQGPSKCTLPTHIEGYYPLYTDMSCSNQKSIKTGGDGTSHKHIFGGVTYFMPNLSDGSKQFHGNYISPPTQPDGCTLPFSVEGFYPLYRTEKCANEASPKGTSHSHDLDADATLVSPTSNRRTLDSTIRTTPSTTSTPSTLRATTKTIKTTQPTKPTKLTKTTKTTKTRRTLLAAHMAVDSTAEKTITYYMPEGITSWNGDFTVPEVNQQGHVGNIYSVSAARSHTCSVRSPRRVGCWGIESDAPNEDKLGFSPTLNVLISSAGAYHTCVLTSEGDIQCGGSNFGNSRKPPYSLCYAANFVYRQGNPICNSTKNIYSDISASVEHTCAIDADTGVVRCFGRNTDTGRLGVKPRDKFGATIPSPGSSPPFGETHGPFLQVTTGLEHTCALRIDGQAICWGQGSASCPPFDLKFTKISSGLWHSCGIINGTGDIKCWGRDYANQVSGAPILNSGTKFQEISAGEEHTCASIAGSSGQIQSIDAVTVLGCDINKCMNKCTKDTLPKGIQSRRRRTAAHTGSSSSATTPPPVDTNTQCDHAVVQAGTVLCWGNIRAYDGLMQYIPEELGYQYSSYLNRDIDNKKSLLDVAQSSNVWIVTKDGPWFYNPKQGMSQMPINPELVFAPCTVALTNKKDFNDIVRKQNENGIRVNNTGDECICEVSAKECGKKYRQCKKPSRKTCVLHSNHPPNWVESSDAKWYGILVGSVFLGIFIGTHVFEVKAAF